MTITSAYNFVPLSPTVVCPEWAGAVSHDLPLDGGLCAELVVEWENHTPLLVGDERCQGDTNNAGVQRVRPFRHPDGIPALPGSALRGMVRNVLEIASFSRMRLLDDRALSIRDFTNAGRAYRERLVGGRPPDQRVGAQPLAKAGWLWFDGADWRLCTTDSYRVQHSLIMSRFGIGNADWRNTDPTWTPSARTKYALLHASPALGGSMAVWFVPGTTRVHDHTTPGGPPLHLAYQSVDRIDPRGAGAQPVPGAKEGVLVVAGQPNPRKHMEFVFVDSPASATSVIVDKAVFSRFAQLHDDPEGDWRQLWEVRAVAGQRVPVFHLTENSRVTAIGLAQMMRLPGRKTVGEMLRSQYAGTPETKSDFATTLFGAVSDEPGTSLRGRIAFGDARLVVRRQDASPTLTVMGPPKPQYYPNYLEQDAPNGQGLPASYRTILSRDAKIRGWKRYPVRPLTEVQTAGVPQDTRPEVQVELHPLQEGLRFRHTIRLHNVHPVELGAVLWALTWGEHAELRHALGLGKSFGYGQMQASISSLEIRPNQDAAEPGADAVPSMTRYIEKFKQWMAQKVPDWAGSEVMTELLAMADPTLPQATRGNLSPLTLTVGARGVNEFADEKEHGYVLRRYSKT